MRRQVALVLPNVTVRRSPKPTEAKSKGDEQDARMSDDKRKWAAKLPSCLLPRCSKKHYIRDCELATTEEKKSLVAELRQKRRKTHSSGKVGTIHSASEVQNNTSLFNATFLNGAAEMTIMADQGSDANIIPQALLRALRAADPKLVVSSLKQPRVFDNANTAAESLRCTQSVRADVELRIRHGEKLMLRGIQCLVCEQPMAHAYIGRHVLTALD